VDDFDHYNSSDNRTWRAWHDGIGCVMENPSLPSYSDNGTVSVAGNENTASFTDTDETIVHGGNQSTPLAYDNTGSGSKECYSQVERTWDTPQDYPRL